MTRHVFFTGGGSAGHVTPNLALIENLRDSGWDTSYVGSVGGIERELTTRLEIPYHQISTGKLRRYFDWQNFLDPILIVLGVVQSIALCLRYKPDIVFSKGGFVAVPLVVAAWICRIPVISHESDITPGLANRLCFPFSKTICVNFPQTEKFLPVKKRGKQMVVTGSPVRESLVKGDTDKGRRFLSFSDSKSILLVFGGSLGAKLINECIKRSLPALLQRYQIIHVVGEGNLDPDLHQNGYVQKEYLHEEFGDVLAAADFVISRAGANSIYELLLLRKCHLLIPLGLSASRGDQIKNAEIFEEAGMSLVLREEELTTDALVQSLDRLADERESRLAAMVKFEVHDAVGLISGLIEETAK